MNKRAFALASAAVALLAASAQAYTIDDEDTAAYWGAGKLNPDSDPTLINNGLVEDDPRFSGDVYDPYGQGYAISGMNVSYASGTLTVTIYSDAYFDNFRSPNSELAGLGSLFLSTDGWNPAGSSANNYNIDGMNAANNGEIWEYAITLIGDTQGDSGVAYRYSTANGFINPGSSRDAQEAYFTAADGASYTEGTWNYELIAGDNALVITMSIGDIWDGSDDLGLHWTMLCANDVVEGSIPGNPVPEPGTLALFAVGALGLAAAGRRRRS